MAVELRRPGQMAGAAEAEYAAKPSLVADENTA
jgi:hypothetical protein